MANESGDSGNREGRAKWTGYAQAALIAVVIVIALYLARAPDRGELSVGVIAPNQAGNAQVTVLQPSVTVQSLTVELTGNVRTAARITVMSEVEGRIVYVAPEFRNGGTIPANEPLVRIDPSEYELRVQAAEAAVTLAAPAGGAALAAAQAELGLAQLELGRTEISYPFEVQVVNSDIEVGELVGSIEYAGPPATMGVVYRSDGLEIDAPITTQDLDYLAPAIGRTARIEADSATWAAEVMRVSSIVAPRTRLASVFLRFVQDETAVALPPPGTFVEIEIDGPAFEDVYTLPDAVLQQRDTVWVVNDGALSLVAPRAIGRTSEGLVVESFDAGQGIVVGTLPGAAEGLAVDIVGQ